MGKPAFRLCNFELVRRLEKQWALTELVESAIAPRDSHAAGAKTSARQTAGRIYTLRRAGTEP